MFYKMIVPLNANVDFCMRMGDQFYDQLYLGSIGLKKIFTMAFLSYICQGSVLIYR